MNKLITFILTLTLITCFTFMAFAQDLTSDLADSVQAGASSAETAQPNQTAQTDQTSGDTAGQTAVGKAASEQITADQAAAVQKAQQKQAAAAVDKKISAIGKVKLNDRKRIRTARKSYDSLEPAAQGFVKKYKILKKAEKKYAKLKKAENYRNGLAHYIRTKNGKISKSYSRKLAGYFIKYEKKYRVDAKALMAIAYHESRFTASAYNPGGYYGMCQTSAAIGRAAGYSTGELYSASNSIHAAAKNLRYNLSYFRGSYYKAFAGYCAGTGGAARGAFSHSQVKARTDTRAEIKRFLKKKKYI